MANNNQEIENPQPTNTEGDDGGQSLEQPSPALETAAVEAIDKQKSDSDSQFGHTWSRGYSADASLTGTMHVTNPEPLYAQAQAETVGVPGLTGRTAMNNSRSLMPGTPAGGRESEPREGPNRANPPGDVQPQTPENLRQPSRRPAEAGPERAPASSPEGGDGQPGAGTRPGDGGAERSREREHHLSREKFDLNKETAEMRRNIADMKDPEQRAIAERGLQRLLDRTDPTKATETSPPLSQDEVARSLHHLNSAFNKPLSNLMGDSQQSREANRDRVVAGALDNFGDSAGIKQGAKQTCLLTGKYTDQVNKSPSVAAKIMSDAMTSQDGKLTMPDGSTIQLHSSYMQADAGALRAKNSQQTGSRDRSADVELTNGIYANAVNQPKGLFFTNGRPTGQGDSGDRLHHGSYTGAEMTVKNEKGQKQVVDNPFVGRDDSANLNAMTQDGGLIATNAQAWDGGRGNANFKDIRNQQDLSEALKAGGGSLQVGLNGHILFRGTGIGAEGGGHLTTITGQRTTPDGTTQFFVKDSNTGTSGWYDGTHVMAAINNDKTYNGSTVNRGQGAADVINNPSLLPQTRGRMEGSSDADRQKQIDESKKETQRADAGQNEQPLSLRTDDSYAKRQQELKRLAEEAEAEAITRQRKQHLV